MLYGFQCAARACAQTAATRVLLLPEGRHQTLAQSPVYHVLVSGRTLEKISVEYLRAPLLTHQIEEDTQTSPAATRKSVAEGFGSRGSCLHSPNAGRSYSALFEHTFVIGKRTVGHPARGGNKNNLEPAYFFNHIENSLFHNALQGTKYAVSGMSNRLNLTSESSKNRNREYSSATSVSVTTYGAV